MAYPKKRFDFTKASAFLLAIFSATIYLSYLTRSELHEAMRQIRLGEKAAFIETLANSPIDGPLDTQPLRDLCASQNWTEGLIVSCAPSEGGISDMRNSILNCVRYAIEAGGAFVIPSSIAQSPLSAGDEAHSPVNFSHTFDRPYFITSLVEGCPQMRLYTNLSELNHLSPLSKRIPLIPSKLSPTLTHSALLANPSQWRPAFDVWLEKQSTHARSLPVLVDLHTPVLHFPITYDAPSFTANFGKIMRFRSEAKALAGSVLYNLSFQLSQHVNPSVPITRNTFVGAHIMSAMPYSEEQFDPYLSTAISHNLSTIYVASLSSFAIEGLRAAAATLPTEVKVVTKSDLLSVSELRTLAELSSYQTEAVDMEVLSRCGIFVGEADSSLAWNVALSRHAVQVEEDKNEALRLLEAGMGGSTEESGTWLEGPQTAEDGYSILLGKVGDGDAFAYGMWH